MRSGTGINITTEYSFLPYLFLFPALIFIIVFSLFPVVYNLILSLSDKKFLIKQMRFVGGKNYLSILTNVFFWRSLYHTFLFVLVTGLFQFICALAAIFIISERRKKIFVVIILLPWAISEISASIIWHLILAERAGGLNSLLMLFKLNPHGWLRKPLLAFIMISVAEAWRYFPLLYLILVTGIYAIPQEIIDMTKIECTHRRTIIFRVYLPMIKKIVFVGLLVTMVRNFRAFTIIFSLTGGGPLRSTELITLFIYKKAFFENDIAQAATVSIIILIIYSFLSHLTLRMKRRRPFA